MDHCQDPRSFGKLFYHYEPFFSTHIYTVIINLHNAWPKNTGHFSHNGLYNDYVASLSCLPESLLLLGDFNVHCDDSSNAQVKQFLDLLQAH